MLIPPARVGRILLGVLAALLILAFAVWLFTAMSTRREFKHAGELCSANVGMARDAVRARFANTARFEIVAEEAGSMTVRMGRNNCTLHFNPSGTVDEAATSSRH